MNAAVAALADDPEPPEAWALRTSARMMAARLAATGPTPRKQADSSCSSSSPWWSLP
ncbi:MAG TPA: hypothetical protein VGG75_41805 [Trebonia sp.]